MELWVDTTDDSEGAAAMLKVVLEAASEPFSSVPYLLVLLVAAIALVVAVFLVRYRRKGDK